jgi:hypothetical protein
MCYCHYVWYLLKLDVVGDLFIVVKSCTFFLTNLSFMCLNDSGIYLSDRDVGCNSAGSWQRRTPVILASMGVSKCLIVLFSLFRSSYAYLADIAVLCFLRVCTSSYVVFYVSLII